MCHSHNCNCTEHTWACDSCDKKISNQHDSYHIEYDLSDRDFEELDDPKEVCRACFENEVIECPHCYNMTSAIDLQRDGCVHCGLGVETSREGLGIQCEICDRCYADDCDWRDALSKLVWQYGIENDDWHMMCPHCQEDPEITEYWDEQADGYYLHTVECDALKNMRTVIQSIPNGVQKYVQRCKDRCAFRTFLLCSLYSDTAMESLSRGSFMHAQNFMTALLA